MGFLLAISSLSVSAANATVKEPIDNEISNDIEYRLLCITTAIEKRRTETINTLLAENENLLVRGFANRSGGGGFVNRGGGFANRSGGGGFVNRSPWRNGGSFYNRY